MQSASGTVNRLNTALAGRYLVERELARGGMATVFLAEDLKHHRAVALKVFAPEVGSAITVDRFLGEIATTARLNHPHILALYDSGEADGLLFYVMPYIGGESLRELLKRRARLPVDEAVRLAGHVAGALQYAHGRGLIHRDIKPENILIHEGEAMVTDFGIAKVLDEAQTGWMTQTGQVLGTPLYMSPEQGRGLPLDARTDIYSLACVLFEMLTGGPPFKGSTAAETIQMRLTETAPSVRHARPEVPEHVDRALVRALAAAPAARFPTAEAFAGALVSAPIAQPGDARSVAVLPFLNLGPAVENDYFADGITEDVIAQLAKVPNVKVISRASVMKFRVRDEGLRSIAAQLGVSTVLDGSVRRAGNRVRIVAQLVDVSTDQSVWSETYDRELTDIFAIQTDVALHIATALDAELTADERSRIRRPPTADLEAYQLYLRGRQFLVRFTFEGLRKSIEVFEEALARDPNYALAYTGMALAYLELGESGWASPMDTYRHAQHAIERALACDPALGEAHCMKGQLMALCDFDWTGAEAALRRAIELSPGAADTYDFYGRLCAALERWDEAIHLVRKAQELDPLSHRSDYATTLLRAGRYAEALDAARAVVDLDPTYDRALATLGWAYIKNGRTDEGLAALERARTLSPRSIAWLAQLGEAYALAGRGDDARRILDEMHARSQDTYVSPYHYAYVYTGLGESDVALDWLERAYQEKSGAVYGIKGSFLFAPLKSHPRFKALLRRLNL